MKVTRREPKFTSLKSNQFKKSELLKSKIIFPSIFLSYKTMNAHIPSLFLSLLVSSLSTTAILFFFLFLFRFS